MSSTFSLLENQAPRNTRKIAVAAVAVLAVCAITVAVFAGQTAAPTVNLQMANVEPWISAMFSTWTAKYNKLYASNDETVYRLTVFRNNALKVKQHAESGSKSYNLTLNQFADLTSEEFKAKYLTLKAPTTTVRNEVSLPTAVADSVDWRTAGAVNAVKDQGQCGSCWAFSTIASVEGLAFQQTNKLEAFSEQQLVDCSTSYGNQGCNGGLMDQGFKYVQEKGIELESTYGYKAVDQKCKAKASSTAFSGVKGFTDVPASNEDQLAAAIAQQVVSVAIEADQDAFQLYNGGIIDDVNCGTQLDHGVTAVGYGSNFYIVRNSWGPSWGEKGYVRIARSTGSGNPGICGIALSASYPTA